MSYQYETIPDSVSVDYLDKIEAIERLKGNLHTTESDLTDILNHDIHETTALEGNQLTAKEVAYYLENNESLITHDKASRDYIQIQNCKDTFNLIKNCFMKRKIELTEEFICEIHALLTKDELPYKESGFYRADSIHIQGTNYIPPVAEEIPEHMTALIQNYYRPLTYGVTPFERICEFKRNFERIHPFIDGNGRTGRVLMNILFLQNGYDYVFIPADERDLYFDALEQNTLHEYLADKMLNIILSQAKG